MSDRIPVDIEFVLKNLNFDQEASKMKQGIRGVTSTAQKEADQIQRIYRNMAAGIGVYFSARFLKEFITQIATVRGEFQQLEVSLETFLQNKGLADKLMSQVVAFASTTPFELQDVAKGTKQLLAYGFAAGDIIKNFKMLGDVAAGLSIPIGDLIYLYGTLNTQGRAYTRDILQFTSRGIPIIDELAKQYGVAKDQIQGMVEAGTVGFADVEKAFQNMTGEGGKFFGLIDNISELIPVKIANMKDEMTKALNGLGEENENLIAGSIEAATALVKNYEKIIDILQVLVASYGAYKAATIAVAVAESFRNTTMGASAVSNMYKMVGVTKTLTLATWAQTKATAAMNAVMAINPYVAAAVALAGLVTILSVTAKEVKKTQDFIDDLNQSIERVGKQAGTDRLIDKYEELSKKTKLTKDEQSELNKTIQELGTIFPDAIGKTDEYGKAVDLVTDKLIANNEALRENIQITTKEEIDEAQAKLDKLISKRNQLLEEINTGKATRTSTIVTGSMGQGRVEHSRVVDLNPDEIKESRAEVNQLTSDIDQLAESVNDSNQKLFELRSGDAERILAPYKNLFKEASEYSKDQAKQVKADLVRLLGAGLGAGADTRIKSQIDSIDVQLGLPSIKKQVADTRAALATAKADLASLRQAGSNATIKQLEDQGKLVKGLVSKLETLTGVKQKKEDDIKSLKEQIDKLYKDLETADEKDRKIIAGRVVELEKELELRKSLAEQAVKVANNQKLKPVKLTGDKVRGIITNEDGYTLRIGKNVKNDIRNVNIEFDKLNKRIVNINKGSGNERLQQMGEMVYAASYLTDQLTQQLGLNEDQSQVLKDGFQAMSGIANIASGNVIQGATQLLSSAISMFVNAPEQMADHYENVNEQINKTISSINIANEALSNLNVNSLSTSLAITKNELKDLADEAKRLIDNLEDSSSQRRSTPNYFYSGLVDEAASLNSEIEELSERLLYGNLSDDQRKAIEAVLNSYNELISQIDSITQELTGTTVQSLGESLAEAFLAGEDAAEAWGQKVDDIIKHVIVKQLSTQLLNEPIQKAIEQLVTDIGDGTYTGDPRKGGKEVNIGLTPEEAATFRDSVQNIYDTAQPAFDEMVKALGEQGFDFGSGTTDQAGLKGAVRRELTEETAGELAGIIRKTSDDIRKQVTQIEKANILFGKIDENTAKTATNTAKTVTELQAAVVELKTIASNTSQGSSAYDMGAG